MCATFCSAPSPECWLAQDVRSADPNGFSDPYALVFVGKNKPKKTKIVKKNLSPKWEESFEFPLTRHDTTLQVQVRMIPMSLVRILRTEGRCGIGTPWAATTFWVWFISTWALHMLASPARSKLDGSNCSHTPPKRLRSRVGSE